MNYHYSNRFEDLPNWDKMSQGDFSEELLVKLGMTWNISDTIEELLKNNYGFAKKEKAVFWDSRPPRRSV